MLRVDGRLSGDASAELAGAAAKATTPLTLELSGLLFADGEGVKILKALRTRGATLRGVSQYLQLLLQMD